MGHILFSFVYDSVNNEDGESTKMVVCWYRRLRYGNGIGASGLDGERDNDDYGDDDDGSDTECMGMLGDFDKYDPSDIPVWSIRNHK